MAYLDTRSKSAAYGSAAVRFVRGSALHVLLLDDHHASNERVLSAVIRSVELV